MPTEVIHIHGQKVETLRELLRPGLSAIFVGLNPSPVYRIFWPDGVISTPANLTRRKDAIRHWVTMSLKEAA
jgi:hypothetical protein